MALWLAAAAPALAQPGPQPFGTLELSAGGAVNVNRTLLHRYWQPAPGAEISAVTPFYAGRVAGGLVWHRYQALRPEVPAFGAVLLFAGWETGVKLTPGLGWFGGLRVGNHRMMFDEDTYRGVRTENELVLGLESRLQLRLFDGWSLYAGGSYAKTFTYVRLRLAHVTVGVRRTIATPAWLEALLR